MVVHEVDADLFARVQERNLIRQYDLLTNCIEIGIQKGPEALDKYTLWALNHVAVANIAQFGGRLREEPIYVGNHIPPHFKDVPDLMDRFISFIHENWYAARETQLAAYAPWRLNWIHPFVEGNGRTARATAYYILCVRSRRLLPGSKIVPERIREDRRPYIQALRAADQAWANGNLDTSQLEGYIADLLQAQLAEALPQQGTNAPAQPSST
jgi:Fic family protein